MRLDINLASAPYQDSSRFWLRWGTMLGGLSLITIILVYTAAMGWAAAAKDRKLIADCQKKIAVLDDQRNDAMHKLSQNSAVRDRSQFLNDLFARKAFSWTKVFEDMERVMPKNLHVVSIQPEMSPEHQLILKLVVAGESRDRAIELVRNMEDSHHFKQAQIVQENMALTQTPGDNVQFEINALYVPDSSVTTMAAKRSAR